MGNNITRQLRLSGQCLTFQYTTSKQKLVISPPNPSYLNFLLTPQVRGREVARHNDCMEHYTTCPSMGHKLRRRVSLCVGVYMYWCVKYACVCACACVMANETHIRTEKAGPRLAFLFKMCSITSLRQSYCRDHTIRNGAH